MLREAPSWVLLGWGCWDGVWSLAGGGLRFILGFHYFFSWEFRCMHDPLIWGVGGAKEGKIERVFLNLGWLRTGPTLTNGITDRQHGASGETAWAKRHVGVHDHPPFNASTEPKGRDINFIKILTRSSPHALPMDMRRTSLGDVGRYCL